MTIRERKAKAVIIEDARVKLRCNIEWGRVEVILGGLWRTAFERGHIRGVEDERNRPKVQRVITKYVLGSPPITNARDGREDTL